MKELSKIQPLDNRLMVKRDFPEVFNGTLWIPDVAQSKTQTGVVVAVGPGKRTKSGGRKPMEVRVGDKIVFGRFTDWEDWCGDFCIIQDADIVGIKEL